MNTMQASHTRLLETQQPELYQRLVTEAGKLYSLAETDKTSATLTDALHLCLTAIDINSTGLQALNLCARIYLDLGQYSQAEQWINRALAIKPDSLSALYSAGHVAIALNKLENAERFFSSACKISKVATRSASSLAYVYLQRGKYVEAFQLYRELIKTQANDHHIRSKLMESASHMVSDFYSDELEQDLLRYLEFDDVDHSQLRSLVTSLLHHKLQLSDEGTPLEFSQLAADPLLLKALQSFYFCDPTLERMFITLRQSILLDAAQNMNISGSTLDLAQALACQAQLNEYVWPITQQERSVIDGLEDLLLKVITTTQWTADDISPALLVLSQYLDVSDNHLAIHLNQICNSNWPEYLATVLTETLSARQRENATAARIPYWDAELNDKNYVSVAVQQQYEENPYPRWKDIGFNTPSSYRSALHRNFSRFDASSWPSNRKLNVLVAGCGTGRQAIRLAKYFDDLNILAIDLSRKALAYAQNKATELNCSNIQFLQADILEINNFPFQFDVIECSGVLHHMEYPEQGLKSLLQLLKPNGMLKLALYSRTARQQVIAFRSLIEKLESKPDPRILRQALLLKQLPGEWNDILSSPDFYSMSNCRDLLFHEQEHQFDLNEIEKLLSDHHLQYVGMVAENKAKEAMQSAYGRFSDDLSTWKSLEESKADIFDGMYQFYSQKLSC